MKIGILLINLGTPDSPSVADVRKYLTQFLNDPYVIDINPVARFFLVNFIIVPFRAKKSAELYEKIWTKDGSPLLFHTKNLKEKLQRIADENFIVEFGMRYQNPSIYNAFRKLIEQNVEKIIAIPLYPQYAMSSTGSTLAELERVMKKINFFNTRIVEPFFQNENFLNAWAVIAKKYLTPITSLKGEGNYDFFLFSYHGLPERQIFKECKKRRNAEGGRPKFCTSISDCDADNPFCYRAACYETTRQFVKRLHIPEGKYTTSFQSRLDDKWLKPYSDKVVEDLAKKGIKKLLVFSPAFVADCLETIQEIGVEYADIFKKHGGEKLQLVESLNSNEVWVEALAKILRSYIVETDLLQIQKG